MSYSRVAKMSIVFALMFAILALALGVTASQLDDPWRIVVFILAGAGVGAAAACIGIWDDNRKAQALSAQERREEIGDAHHAS